MAQIREDVTIFVNTEGTAQVANQFSKLESIMRRVSDRVTLVGQKIDNNLNKPLRSMTDAINVTKFSNLNNELIALGGNTPKLRVEFESLTASGKQLARQQAMTNRMMNGGAQRLVENAGRVNKLGNQFDSLSGTMRMPLEPWKKFNQEGGRFNSIGGRVGNRFRNLTHGLRGFRMEMLGVMFFGMGMSRMLKGLLQPALEMVGVFDIFRTALAILFLPLALFLLDVGLKFLDWVLSSSDASKKFWNWIVALGIVLGTFLFLVGTLALGLGSIVMVFGGAIAMAASFFASLLSGIGVILSFIPSWGKLIVGAGIFTTLFALASQTVGAFSGALETTKGFLGGILDKFVKLDAVQGILDKLGIKGKDWAEVWKNIKDKVIENLGELGDTWKWLFQVKIPLYIMLVKAKMRELYDDITSKLTGDNSILTEFQTLAKELNKLNFGVLLSTLNTLLTVLNNIISALHTMASLIDEVKGVHVKVTDIASDAGVPVPLSTNQLGGYIPHTGAYKLHAGETVTPAGSDTINFAPNITINATSNVDIDVLKNQLSEELFNQVERRRR